MPFKSIDGIKRYYEAHGQGTTILLMHHGFGCTKMWKDIYPSLVAAGYRVVMYDRRGYGRSEKGADFEKFYVGDSFRRESVTELETLREMLDLDAFHIVGQCEGGVIGVEYAAKNPSRVLSLATSSTQCFSTVTMVEFNRLKFPKPFRDLEPDLREKLIQWHGKDNAEDFFNQFRSYGGAYGKGVFDLRDLLRSVRCPTLVLYPDRSFLFDIEQGVQFYRHLPEGELAVLPKCGHNTYEHQPEQYIQHVLDFLERHGA